MRALFAAPAASLALALLTLRGLLVSIVSIIVLVSLRRPAARLASGAAGQ